MNRGRGEEHSAVTTLLATASAAWFGRCGASSGRSGGGIFRCGRNGSRLRASSCSGRSRQLRQFPTIVLGDNLDNSGQLFQGCRADNSARRRGVFDLASSPQTVRRSNDENPWEAGAAEVGLPGDSNVGAAAAGPEGVHVAVDAVEGAGEGFLGEGFRRREGWRGWGFSGGDGGHVMEESEVAHGQLGVCMQDGDGADEGQPGFARRAFGAARKGLEVEERRARGEARPADEVGSRTGPDPLFRRAAAVPGKVDVVVGVVQGVEEGAVRQGKPLGQPVGVCLARFEFLGEYLPEGGYLDARPQFFQLPERFDEIEPNGADGQRRGLLHDESFPLGRFYRMDRIAIAGRKESNSDWSGGSANTPPVCSHNLLSSYSPFNNLWTSGL